MRWPLPVIAILMLLPAAAFADATSDARKAIAAVYSKQDATVAARDVGSLLLTCTPDYVEAHHEEDAHGATLSRADVETQLGQVFNRVKTIHRTVTITSFKLEGDTAHVGGRLMLIAVMPAQGSAMDSQFSQIGTIEDTWVRTPKGWMLSRSDIMKAETRIKPIQSPTVAPHKTKPATATARHGHAPSGHKDHPARKHRPRKMTR
jgi:hypothetical protein